MAGISTRERELQGEVLGWPQRRLPLDPFPHGHGKSAISSLLDNKANEDGQREQFQVRQQIEQS